MGRRKRSIEPIVVTVVSDELFDDARNEEYLKVAQTLQKITNKGGKFAVEYTVIAEADCYAIRNFVVDAKKTTKHFNYATVMCDDGKFVV
ncbi:unnamed protein product [Heligmosomoides polygyrus]|uniref:Cystatin domain-containing protein n=1 Tax=Heligmosomoides polygyrus TaxID=6339 RepID=A0A183G2V3_HELPZ|nr:unnamed protein product [Heligmosomoides polygyrus]